MPRQCHGNNNIIRCTGNDYFKSYGKIICDEPAGLDNIYIHIGTGETLIEYCRYINPQGYPFTISSTVAGVSARTENGVYATSYRILTAAASFNLTLGDSIDTVIIVSVGTNNGEFTLASIDDGKFDGQNLVIRAIDSVGTNGLIIPSSIGNINLAGGDITIEDGENRRFYWTGAEWYIESRSA